MICGSGKPWLEIGPIGRAAALGMGEGPRRTRGIRILEKRRYGQR